MGGVKISSSNPKTTSTMSTSLNINARTVAPTIVNPESVPVDSDLEEDLEEIQRKVVAEQAQIEEATRAMIAVPHERIEKKDWEWKAEEEEHWVAREKALEESRKQQLKVSCHCSCFLVGTDLVCRC